LKRKKKRLEEEAKDDRCWVVLVLVRREGSRGDVCGLGFLSVCERETVGACLVENTV
jgi:hypothetical protein